MTEKVHVQVKVTLGMLSSPISPFSILDTSARGLLRTRVSKVRAWPGKAPAGFSK